MPRSSASGTLGPVNQAETIEAVRVHYDRIGSQEWLRLTKDVAGRVSLEVHRRFLRRFVRPGSRVLEIGAGPGRFTLELADLGCRIVVTDLSPVQLDLNVAQLAGTPAERCVDRHEVLDVCDTTCVGCTGTARSSRSSTALAGLSLIPAPATGPRCRTPMRWRRSRSTSIGGPDSSSTRSRPALSPVRATAGLTSCSRHTCDRTDTAPGTSLVVRRHGAVPDPALVRYSRLARACPAAETLTA